MSKRDKSKDKTFKKWPVAELAEFEMLIIDATRWHTGEYTAQFNLYQNVAQKEDEQNTGLTLLSQLCAPTLRELFERIDLVVMSGLFDGIYIDAHGTLYNEQFQEVAEICWMQYHDDIYDEDEDDDTTGLFPLGTEHDDSAIGLQFDEGTGEDGDSVRAAFDISRMKTPPTLH
jgi:hypothetical protein